jgi:translocator protein
MSYFPSLTLPPSIFTSLPLSLALPPILGMASGLISQPGAPKPKSTTDDPSPTRGTWRDSTKQRYAALRQPPFRPPPWLFAPAWTTLYLLMGYASHRAWTVGMASLSPRIVEDTRRGATLYTIQLGLNLLYMPLFFGLGRPVEALLDVSVLTGSVGYLAYIWNKVDRTASLCLWPYVAWLGFATYLTAGTGYLNGWSTKDPKERAKKAE